MVATIPTPSDKLLMGNWGKAYTTEQVSRLAPPVPTDTHKPRDHHALFDMVSGGLTRAGFEHSEPLHYVGNGNIRGVKDLPAKFMTVMNIRHSSLGDHVGGLETHRQLFIQNSYDKSLSIRLITGIEICICTNGMTMGHVENEIRRKQTKNVDGDIYGIVYGGIDRILGEFKSQDETVHQLQNTEMTNRMADHIIMDAMRADVINPAGVKDVWEKWHNPNYAEYKDRNAWSLANAFTERSRGRNIFSRHQQHGRLLELINGYTDYSDSASKTVYTPEGTPTVIENVTSDF
tara:strand:- start:2155 stop:3024 length:870 start_codon:yes stop_codon:yes gene_type:complete